MASSKLHTNVSRQKRCWLIIELLLIFVGLPLLLTFQSHVIRPIMLIVPLLSLVLLYLRRQPDFVWQDLWRLDISPRIWLTHLVCVFVAFVLLLAYTVLFEPKHLFKMPVQQPAFWLLVMVFYPVLSAYGQEVMYRVFLNLRYRPVLGDGRLFVAISAALFSFAHIIYFSPLSIVLTFVLGVWLAWLYIRFRSVLFVAILHGLLGDAVFTVGLGHHFWVNVSQLAR